MKMVKKFITTERNLLGGSDLNSIIEKPNIKWVDVAGRSLDGWGLYDNRRTDWTGNYPVPFKMGTRIVAINANDKYVIQRYVINPEAKSIAKTIATIHRQELNDPNMDWYNEQGVADEDYQIFTLDKEVTGEIADIRLGEYNPTNITDKVKTSTDKTRYGEPARLKLEFPATNKPIVVDIKVPYKYANAGVGTGMDWTENGTTYWKADFYERVNIIKETSPVLEQSDGIQGSYISDDFLDVENEAKTYGFKIKKVKDEETDTIVQGAKFKLTGLDESKEEREMTTGQDGIIYFDKLKPGKYKLEESKPAPGYEKSNVIWTVRVAKDGKVYIKENGTGSVFEPNAEIIIQDPNDPAPVAPKSLFRSPMRVDLLESASEANSGLEIGDVLADIRNPLRAGDGWEVVDNASSTQPTTRQDVSDSGFGQLIETKIIEIDKENNRYKQVFIYKEGFAKKNRNIKFHRAYDNYNIKPNEVTTRVFQVPNGTSLANINESSDIDLIPGKTDISKNIRFTQEGTKKIQTTNVNTRYPGTILIEVETNYIENQPIGLGSNYNFNTTGQYGNKCWLEKSYTNEANVPVIKPTVYRTITFDGNGGTWHMSPVTVEDGIVYELPGSSFIAPDGKEFDGWLVNRQKKNPGDKIVVTSDLTITAQWRQKAPEQVTVSFIPGEGSGTMQDKKVNLGSNYQLPANGFIAPTGKEFKAWSVNGVEYQPGAIIQVKADTTLTALWKMKAPTTYNIIVQNPQEGGMVFAEPTSATAGTEITLTVTPNKGYEIQSVTMNGQVLTADTDGKYKFEMPAAEATVSAIFKQKEDKPEDGEEEIPSDGFAQITNRQTGIELKIYKKSSLDAALKGAIFELKKTDDDYTVDDTSFGTVIGVSDEKGNVRFEDENDNPVKLQVGKYLLTETKAPAGFKKPPAPWKLEVVEEGGKLVIKQSGPKHSSTSYLSSDGAKAGDNLSTDETIKYKSIIKNIDPVNKTFIQRIYIDTRGYKGSDKINVQITPTTKREEIDTPGAPPKTTSGGVKTAYRTTYKVSNPAADLKPDDVLDDYDLRKSNVSVVNTARWRPFDWGFDEDQINLSNDGVYFIDIEGFYDDNIVDLEEIELKVDFYGGERVFAQRTYDKTTNQLGWTIDKDIGVDEDGNQVKRDAAYLLGMVALKDLYQHHNGAPAANTWYNSNPDNGKYDIYLRKGAYVNGTYYDAGRIVLANDPNNPNNPLNITPIQSSIVKADIKDLYSSDNISNVPQEGMTITNEDETYNITFSKHSKEQDDPAKEDFNNNRLEGAVFKLEKKEGSFWYDVDESYVASAFNGYFGFRKLEPGRYRLIEVTPPEGYKPIEGPLLEFTIKQLDTSSDKILNPKTQEEFNLIDLTIIDPYNQKKIVLEDAKAKLKEDPEDKIYDFKNLVADEKFDLDTVIILSEVKENGKAKEITLKEASFIDPELDEPMGRIISGAQGFITLEYAPGDYVSEYGKAGSSGGSLVDYVTSATAKNMGKILNEKPGRGRVTIKKIDENGGAIGLTMDSEGKLTVGAKFEATRISAKKDGKGKPIDEAKYSGTVDENGQLVIDGLPIGNYELREVENPSGYINTGQIWHFTVGGKELDPYAGEIARTGNDLTSLISLEKSDLTVVRPNEEDKTITEDSEGNNIIRPHLGQSLEFDNSFKFNSNVKIQPGDYFVVKLDNIDLDGVKTGGAGNLDIFADGVGTIAKADYDKQRGTITYTFTQYAEQYNLINFENKLAAHITFSKVRNSAQTKVGLSVGEISKLHDIEVKYDLDTVERYHDNSTVNLASKIVEYNTNTGEFVHYFYVNRDRSYNAKDMYFEYSPSLDVENLQFTYYRLRNNSDYYINQSMPESFAVKEYDNNLYRAGGSSPQSVSANETMTRNIGNLGPNGSMIIKVTGRIKKEDNTNSYKGISGLYSTYKYYYDNSGEHTGVDPYVNRWDTIFDLDNKDTASADLTISVVNPANKIKFKKVDPQGQAIRPEADKQAAQFLLYKNDGTIERPNENWSEVEKAKDVDEDGIITYEKLEKGYYKLVETTAPKGYIKPTDPVAYFKVDETGKIYKEITITKEDGTTEKIYEEVEGTIPINIVNNKPIEFEKVDANDNTNKLEGAVFKVLYKEKETDKYSDYEVNGGVLKVTSGEDGKLKLNLTKSGYYALEETTAPEGYSKLPGYIKEFKLENGKAQILEKSIEKISQRTSSKGLMTSEILSVNKEDNTFTQRIVINPNHGKLNVKDNNSSLNILENGWRVINRKSGKIGGQVRVALIKEAENKRIADLKDDDYNSYYAIGSGYASLGNDIVYRYGLKEMLGLETTSESITTTDTMVIEYTGKLNNVNEIGQKLVVELSDFENDSLDYNLNPDKLADNKATYVDRIQEDPIQIENKKVSLPNTNGLAAWIGFTILGLIFMTLAGFYYNKKKNLA